jgi:hypothetical protein
MIREGVNPWLEVNIIEGRNRQVRKMFEEVGHHVEKIRRVQYGPLALDIPPGDWRNLTLLEVAKLKSAASGPKLTLPPPSAAASPDTTETHTTKLARVPKSVVPSRPQRKPSPWRSQKPAVKSSYGSRSPRPAREKAPFAPRAPRPLHSEKPSFIPRSSGPSRSEKGAFAPRSSRAPQSKNPARTPRATNFRTSRPPKRKRD